MENEVKKVENNGKKSVKLRNFIIIVIMILLFYFILLKPYLNFKSNERALRNAGVRFFELNDDKLPTGKRVSTVTLQELAASKYVESDFYEPFSKKLCSITKSWVKVKKEGSNYKYYTYLDCGVVSSTGVDHTGPVVTLKDKENITVDRYSDFTDPGIESVIDDTDGKIDTNKVSVKGKVDTDVSNTYEIVYTVSDSLNNTTKVIRKVNVVERIRDTIKKATNDTGYYKGDPNNYIYFGANLYRVVGLDNNNNIKIISDTNVGNVNYSALDKYLKKYYNALPTESKKLIVGAKYCNGKLKDIHSTECESYSNETKYSVPSIVDVNKSLDNNVTFMLNNVANWSNNIVDNNNSYAIRLYFNDSNERAYKTENEENYGVRPVITIDGATLIKGGDGTKNNPYTLKDDVGNAKPNTKVNDRYAGEYISIDNHLWRISETLKDGTTKIIYDGVVYSNGNPVRDSSLEPIVKYEYNPKQKGNVGYFANNKLSEFISTEYFVKHTITVPIYKDKSQYGKQISTKKYDVKLSIPSIYDFYNVDNGNNYNGDAYFLMDSYTEPYVISQVTELQTIATAFNKEMSMEFGNGFRPVAYLTEKAYISYGSGTVDDPYQITKK